MKDDHFVDDEELNSILDADEYAGRSWYTGADPDYTTNPGGELDPDSASRLDPERNLRLDGSGDPYQDWDADLSADPGEDEGEGIDEKGAGKKGREDEANKARMELYDWLQCIVSAIICGIFIFVFVGRTIGVDGRSMLQTLHNNDRVIMSNLFYTPKSGDIVVFQTMSDSFNGTPLVKRVIAVAGQTVDINFETGEVFIDGVVQKETYINEVTHNRIDFVGPVTVPEGFIFVLGDNRNSSSDSRDHRVGLVDTRCVLGKVLFIALPGAEKGESRDWSRIGFAH